MFKYNLQADGSLVEEGEFIEEAFADLTRVRGLREIGREPRADGLLLPHGDILYVGKGATAPSASAPCQVSLPVEFAHAAIADSHCRRTYSVPSGMASYGLELLDQSAPGLFAQIKTARLEPHLYKEVIKTMNDVRPGLYKDLRKLTYTHEDFKKGLELIQTAIA